MRREGDCVYDQVAAFATRRGKVNIHHRPLSGYQRTSTGSRVPLDDIPCRTMEVAVSDFRGVREGDLVRVVTSPFTCFNGAVEETSRLIAALPSTRHPTYVPNRGNEPIATVAKSPLFGWAANLGFSLKTKFGQKSAQPDRTFGRLGNTKGGTASGHQGFRTYRFCGAGADRSGPCFGGAILLWASFASLPSAAWRPA